jgi:hypothetical protein
MKWDPTTLDGPTFRALAVPFTGPVNYPGTRGVDLDGEYFSPGTDIGRSSFDSVPLTFHHGKDERLGAKPLGRAVLDEQPSPEGWWATCRWDVRDGRVPLVRQLARRTPLFASTQPLNAVKRSGAHIDQWHVAELTISPSPQNTRARLVKGTP